MIKTINVDKKGEYKKDFMKVKFNSDDNLPLGKILKLCMLTVVVRSVFEEDGKYYSQIFRRIFMKMLQRDRIDVSEGVEINNADASKEFTLCHYWYVEDIGYKFELHVCKMIMVMIMIMIMVFKW